MHYIFVRLFIYIFLVGLVLCLVTENQLFIIYSFYMYLLVFIFYIYRYSMFLFTIKKTSYIEPFVIDEKKQLPRGVTMTLSEFVTYELPSVKHKHIPCFLFRTGPYTIENLPEPVKKAMDVSLQLNPDYVQIYISNKDADQFLKTHYPEYLPSFSSIIPGAFKSDLLRLIILYHYGGYYNDLGHIYKFPLATCFDTDDELILVNDISIPIIGTSGFHNAFIACYPRHPVIKHMLLHVQTNINYKNYGITPLDITGPMTVHRAFTSFFRLPGNTILPLGINTLSHQGIVKEYSFRVRILKFHGSILSVPDIITNEKNQVVINTKFPDYYKILYKKRDVPYYLELWLMGIIYNP